ncbi:hypothetical protein [Actinoplanes utahensis]|uniref:Knr4/Smi1-like domain-containing protein n=1 Tax=Actinoplanes utahensis TaxID=1869 RepID=A0A0A6UD35_ACTUT|nr:hypothetical protein [Actinoplanes utahensis]KHD73955.1 hypothetical protein MB27_31670 [Actinoplanes utahensis]GIF29710.1 hypothetical protein Aut01nite_26960 [Actinoplanes utahensis]
MNDDLRELIEELRADLHGGGDPPVIAYIRDGAAPGSIPAETPTQVRRLLEVADGIWTPDVDLRSAGELAGIQFHLDLMPEFTGVRDDPGAWFVFGTRNQEPLLIRRDTGSVWCFPDDGVWYTTDRFFEIALDFDEFVAYYVFGAGYGEIGSDHDDWWAYLTAQGLTTTPDEDPAG